MKKTKHKTKKSFGITNKYDINGSYTGTSGLNSDLTPVQDVDDL